MADMKSDLLPNTSIETFWGATSTGVGGKETIAATVQRAFTKDYAPLNEAVNAVVTSSVVIVDGSDEIKARLKFVPLVGITDTFELVLEEIV